MVYRDMIKTDISNSFQKIVIILPAFNEATGIKMMLEGIRQNIEGNYSQYLVIVVNDGSTDNTAYIVNSCTETIPIILLEHKINKGVGAAFLTGFKKAAEITNSDDIIVLMEADNTSEIKILKDIINEINRGSDIVCASRYMKGGGYLHFPLKRLIFSKGANILLKVFFPLNSIRDYTIFYRAYKARLIKDALNEYGDNFIEYNGFVANVEVLLKFGRFCPKIGEVPFIYDYGKKKGSSKMKVMKNLFGYLCLFWHAKFQDNFR